MVQGSWIRDQFPVFTFSIMLFIPYECISCPGCDWGFHLLFLDPFLSSSYLFSALSLALMDAHCRGGILGINLLIIRKLPDFIGRRRKRKLWMAHILLVLIITFPIKVGFSFSFTFTSYQILVYYLFYSVKRFCLLFLKLLSTNFVF